MFSTELERDAFRTTTGEFGWTRAQISSRHILRSQELAILGGSLVVEMVQGWDLIPQRNGGGQCTHGPVSPLRESWPDSVERGAADTLAHD